MTNVIIGIAIALGISIIIVGIGCIILVLSADRLDKPVKKGKKSNVRTKKKTS